MLQELELTPLRLQAKEGLSLINGTPLTTALATKGWYAAAQLLQHANLAAACTLEALHGSRQPFDQRVLALHRHPGTIACGAEIRGWLEGPSQIHDCHVNEKWAQDPYSLRCAPQVHGMVWEEAVAVERIIADELNAVADNPILLCDDREAISCGNFHGIYVARAADRLAMALTTLAAMSERRINLAMDGNKTGLPDFLIADGGLRSGLMMVQVTAAALVSECKVLSHPASVDSIPTNNDQEDHVSMGPGAGFKLLEIVERVRSVLAIEFLASSVALDLRHPHLPARRLAAVHRAIREIVPPLVEDRVLAGDIAQLSTLIESEQLLTLREDVP